MSTSPHERSYLLRCLVALLATGIAVGVIDLAACRVRTPASCDPQSSAVYAAVGAAAGYIMGILTKSPS